MNRFIHIFPRRGELLEQIWFDKEVDLDACGDFGLFFNGGRYI